MRTITVCLLAIGALLAGAALQPARADEQLSLVINPRTGEARIRNDISTAINIDGYLLTADSAVFNPAGWTSFQDAGRPNWREGNPAGNHIGELNLFSTIAINGGASLGIGSPYAPIVPTAIGQLEPSLKFEYDVPGVGSKLGDVVFAPQNNVVMLVDPASGNASLQNQSLFDVRVDGILITSMSHTLNPTGWTGLAKSGVSGWQSGAAASNRLGEASLLGSFLLPAGSAPRSIGAAIDPTKLNDENDVTFEYHIAGAGTVKGGVTFAAAAPPIPLAGDYNGNGTVDAADYVVWRNGGPLQNEGVTPGSITVEDYNFWRSRFGMTAPAGSASSVVASAVPEPSAGWLLATGLLVALILVRRSQFSAFGAC